MLTRTTIHSFRKKNYLKIFRIFLFVYNYHACIANVTCHTVIYTVKVCKIWSYSNLRTVLFRALTSYEEKTLQNHKLHNRVVKRIKYLYFEIVYSYSRVDYAKNDHFFSSWKLRILPDLFFKPLLKSIITRRKSICAEEMKCQV